MKHARSDYDAIQPWPTKRPHIAKRKDDGLTVLVDIYPDDEIEANFAPLIPDDEPVFLIRGQDLAAIPAAQAWCDAATALGADPSIVEAVRRHIEVVRAWQREHTKVPDAPASALR